MTRRKAVFDEAMVTTAEAAEQANSYAILSAQIALIEAERKAVEEEAAKDLDEVIEDAVEVEVEEQLDERGVRWATTPAADAKPATSET